MCLFEFVLVVGKRVSVVKTQVFSYSGKGISVKLYSALEERLVRIFRRVVVGPGVLYVRIGGCTCVWGIMGVYLCQDFEGCFLQD